MVLTSARSHLYRDLQPYTCLYTECAFSLEPFRDRQIWSDHLELDHAFGPGWEGLKCPLCLEHTGIGKKKILAHFARHLEDIAVSSMPRDVDNDIESESMSSAENNLDGAPEEEESSTIKCICGHGHNDGNTVLCEVCDTWQHILCYYESTDRVPDVHECVDCSPRRIDASRAMGKQRAYLEINLLGVGGNKVGEARSAPDTKTLEIIVQDPSHSRVSDPLKHFDAKLSPRPSSESQVLPEEHTEDDDDLLRLMARRRKSANPGCVLHMCRECKKEFKRPCDLTKHEKTHSRPWKCSEMKCKYFELGWPTERERDRHLRDKHATTPAQYKCLYPPCTYESKRESNCKQHMEKAHGWEYVRSKSRGRRINQAITEDSYLITPPDDIVLSTHTTAAEGFPTGTESIFNDSGTGLNFNTKLQQYTRALSTDFNFQEPTFTTNPDQTLYNFQSKVDEGFGDAMDALDMQTFTQPTNSSTLFDTVNSSTNSTADFFPDFRKTGGKFEVPGGERPNPMNALSSPRPFLHQIQSQTHSLTPNEPVTNPSPQEDLSEFRPRRPYRSKFAPGTQFRTYQGPGGHRGAGTETLTDEPRAKSSQAATQLSGRDFEYVVTDTPGELKSKKNMTQVRKRAMQHYLDHNSNAQEKSSMDQTVREVTLGRPSFEGGDMSSFQASDQLDAERDQRKQKQTGLQREEEEAATAKQAVDEVVAFPS